jgi:hypothetical protein
VGDANIIKNLKFVEVLFLTELILTYEMFDKNLAWSLFNFDDAFDEIYNASENIYNFVEKHEVFFKELCTSINTEILTNKGFKTNFGLNYKGLDEYIYSNCLIRSIGFINNMSDNTKIDDVDNMLHRNVVMSNVSDYAQVFKLLGGDIKFKELCVKIMMVLGDQILSKKIKFVVKRVDKNNNTVFGYNELGHNPTQNNEINLTDMDLSKGDTGVAVSKKLNKGYEFKTDMYIRFNIIEQFSCSIRFTPVYGKKPFVELGG